MQRIKNDFYPTPALLTKALLESSIELSGTILEPCAGDRAITKELQQQGYRVVANDITDAKPFNDITPNPRFDATTIKYWQRHQNIDWVVINPPFKDAHLILPLALKTASTGVAALLRLTFLEPAKNRADFLQQYASNLGQIIVVNPRPRFRADSKGVDSATVAWFIWKHDFGWDNLGVPCPFIFNNSWKK